MSGMSDIQLQLDAINARLEKIEEIMRIYGAPRTPSVLDDEPDVQQPHWAFEDPNKDNKWEA